MRSYLVVRPIEVVECYFRKLLLPELLHCCSVQVCSVFLVLLRCCRQEMKLVRAFSRNWVFRDYPMVALVALVGVHLHAVVVVRLSLHHFEDFQHCYYFRSLGRKGFFENCVESDEMCQMLTSVLEDRRFVAELLGLLNQVRLLVQCCLSWICSLQSHPHLMDFAVMTFSLLVLGVDYVASGL